MNDSRSASDAYRAAIDRANAGDLAGYLDFYSDDVVFGGATQEPLDKEGVVAFHEGFFAAFPDPHVEIADMIEADGGRLAARLVLHLNHQGEFMGIAATGRDAQLAMTTVLTVRDGRCVERWTTPDMLGLMIQLGAVPAPA